MLLSALFFLTSLFCSATLDKISNGSEASADADAEIYIDPHDLTGKKGLERMMTCIDSKSPPEKGSFEYKRSTLDTYDRIFFQRIDWQL